MPETSNATRAPEGGSKKKKRNQTGYFKEKYYSNPAYRSKLLAKQAEKVDCPNCCKIMNRSSIYRHKKSPKCQKAFYEKKRDDMLKSIDDFNKKYKINPEGVARSVTSKDK